ncbi:helix-turn-helix transcriptional regulator [Oscillatoria amoena NRMC-F 0135]|nr:helix-turn-helix transcriptional regulator [Oscillatoria amoena NRMC-F 0135]
MENTINQRLKILMQHYGLNAEKLSLKANVSSAAIRNIINGKSEPGASLTREILLNFPNVSGDWFITGQGEMLKENETKVSISITEQAFMELKNTISWQRQLIDRLMGGADWSKLLGNNNSQLGFPAAA